MCEVWHKRHVRKKHRASVVSTMWAVEKEGAVNQLRRRNKFMYGHEVQRQMDKSGVAVVLGVGLSVCGRWLRNVRSPSDARIPYQISWLGQRKKARSDA